MSARIDALVEKDGTGYGDYSSYWASEDGGTDGQGATPSNDPRYASGWLQNFAAVGTGYLARYLDVDLSKRIAGMNPAMQLRTTQNSINGYGSVYRNPVTGEQTAQVNLSGLMPLFLVGAAVWFFSRGH